MSQPETSSPLTGRSRTRKRLLVAHHLRELLSSRCSRSPGGPWTSCRVCDIGILIVTIFFGMFMAFNIGGNDVANSFGTSVGAKTLTIKQALLIAAVFEVGGALIAGGDVTDTVRSGIVDLDGVDLDPQHFAYIMMAALLGAALWLRSPRAGLAGLHPLHHRRHRRCRGKPGYYHGTSGQRWSSGARSARSR